MPIISVGPQTLKRMGVLGIVKFPFTKSELTFRYRELSLKTHPDVNDSPDAEEKMKEINEAKTYLEPFATIEEVYTVKKSIEEKKARMDGDIFKLWTTCEHCEGRGWNRDLYWSPEIDCPDCREPDLIWGMHRSVGYSWGDCALCNGKGFVGRDSDKVCPACDGRRRVRVVCNRCNGKRVVKNPVEAPVNEFVLLSGGS